MMSCGGRIVICWLIDARRTNEIAMNEVIRLSARGLGVHFRREADRYRHDVMVEAPDGPQVWLSSVEGAANEAWPPSPPWQDLHLEDRPGGKRVALLVGRAGRAHWSLSVEADVARETLLFDVACRSLVKAEQLGSAYRLSVGCRLEAQRVLFMRHELRLLEGEMQFNRLGHESVSISPNTDAGEAGKVQTFRWRYQIGPASGPACPA